MTREQLAVAAGISYTSIGRMERGTHRPTVETLQAVARALGCTVVDLLTDADASEVA